MADEASPYDATRELRLGLTDRGLDRGDTLGGWRIEKELSHGGMARVYLAVREGEQAAVKVARRELSAQGMKRLRNEFHILADLDHPAIARVYDAGALEDGRPYFVMEYVEGLPIHQHCETAGLNADGRLELFLAVCSAVEAAHERGVVHRDVKPSNILVTPEGIPKLLDFGIAKLLDPEAHTFTVDPTLTHEQPLTPAYASPEQLLGEVATRASDIYSLGVLLYELLTGRRPYPATSVRRMAPAMADAPPALGQAVAADLELAASAARQLDAIVQTALRREPEERYACVADLRRDVERHLAGEAPAARSSVRRHAWRRFLRRHRAALAAAALTVACLAGVYFRPALWGPAAVEFAERDRIVVGAFQNLTGEELLDDSLAAAFRVGLEQSGHARLVSSRDVRQALTRMARDPDEPLSRELAAELSLREGAKVLVEGSVLRIEEGYRVIAELVEPTSTVTFFTCSADAALRVELFAALAKVTAAVRAELGESLKTIAETAPLEKVTTSDLRALRAYSQGIENEDRGDSMVARGLFEQAIALDPDFAMAYAKLAVNYRNNGQPEALAYFAEALARSERLPPYEKLYVKSWVATLDGSLENVVAAWSSVVSLFPDDATAYHNLGTAFYEFAWDLEKATTVYEKGAGIRDQALTAGLNRRKLVECRTGLGDFAVAEAALERFSPLEGDSSYLEAQLILALAREDVARTQELAAVLKSRGAEGTSLLNERPIEVQLRVDRGLLRQALSLVRGVPDAEGAPSWEADEILAGILEVQIEDPDRSRAGLRRWLPELERLLQEHSIGPNFRPLPQLAVLGRLCARRGLVEEAEAILQILAPAAAARALPAWKISSYLLEGEIAFARGSRREAIEFFTKAQAVRETFQAHASLARAYEFLGETASAAAHNDWLLAQRGRAFNVGCDVCQVQGLIEWSYAWRRRARLAERRGDAETAAAAYRRFADRWQGELPAAWREEELALGLRRPPGVPGDP